MHQSLQVPFEQRAAAALANATLKIAIDRTTGTARTQARGGGIGLAWFPASP